MLHRDGDGGAAAFTLRELYGEATKAAAAYLLLGVWAAATLLATLSRSGLLAFAGVMVILGFGDHRGHGATRRWAAGAGGAAVHRALRRGGREVTKDKMYEAAVEDYNLAVYNHETYGNLITVPKPEDRTISMDDLTATAGEFRTTILENLTWNGHKDSVIWEWVAKDGAGRPPLQRAQCVFRRGLQQRLHRRAAAGRRYTALAFIRALRYYWAHRKESSRRRDAAAARHGVHSGGHV